MNSYLTALKNAHLEGYYVPELETCWFREDNFQQPKFWANQHH